MDNTKIEWTDATWNPITGCSVISPGCTNCYAMKLAGTRLQHHESRSGLTIDSKAGPVWNGQVRFNPQWLDQPVKWRRPRMIFVCAHGDLFHESVPDEWIDEVFAVMALAQQHTFQILTKRADRMLRYLLNAEMNIRDSIKYDERAERMVWPLANVWVGVSVEDQHRADERIPLLLATPAAVRWISAEPLLGSVDLLATGCGDILCRCDACLDITRESRIDWVVVGGESGAGARPMHPQWARDIRDQCAAAGVPFLFKQWGEWAPQLGAIDLYEFGEVSRRQWAAWSGEDWDHWNQPAWCDDIGEPEHCLVKVGKKAAGRLLDGIEWNQYPETRT